MYKSGLIELLKTFSAREFREFGEFISSPFFNKNSKVTALYNIIKKSYPDFESPALKKEKVFGKIYPGKKFTDSTLRLLMFYLFENAKKYIQVSAAINMPVRANLDLAADLIERNLIKESERTLKEVYELIDKMKFKDEEYFWYRYLADREHLTLQEKQFSGRYEKYMTSKTFNEFLKNLTDHYLIRTLKHYTVVLNINILYKTNFSLEHYKRILGVFEKEYFQDTPLLELYYNASKMLENSADEQSYFHFKNLLIRELNNIDNDSLLDLFINLENYCVRKGREGVRKFDRELFEIYQMELDKKLYVQGNFMTHYFYKSVAATALMIKEFDWAEKFVKDYQNELHADFRNSAYYHCYARIEIARKDYNKALEYLSKVKSDEIYLKTETKLLFTVVYYELGIVDSLFSLLDTMRHFFKNDRFMSDERKNFYWDYVKILNKLSAARQKNNSENIQAIKQQIDQTEKLFLKNWLLEKANEL